MPPSQQQSYWQRRKQHRQAHTCTCGQYVAMGISEQRAGNCGFPRGRISGRISGSFIHIYSIIYTLCRRKRRSQSCCIAAVVAAAGVVAVISAAGAVWCSSGSGSGHFHADLNKQLAVACSPVGKVARLVLLVAAACGTCVPFVYVDVCPGFRTVLEPCHCVTYHRNLGG